MEGWGVAGVYMDRVYGCVYSVPLNYNTEHFAGSSWG